MPALGGTWGLAGASRAGLWGQQRGLCCGEAPGHTTLSYSSRVSLSPAVLLKLLVLEEEREMFDRPFSFSFIKGLGRGGMKQGRWLSPGDCVPWALAGDRPSCTTPGMNLLGCFSTQPRPKAG